MLVLQTADRDEILFSVPHSHAPFGQSFKSYNEELEHWVNNFRGAGIESVNFGYIFIHQLLHESEKTYYSRIVSNPTVPVYGQVQRYFDQRQFSMRPDRASLFLELNPDIRFRLEFGHPDGEHRWELFAKDNPYYTTYLVNGEVFQGLQFIARTPTHLGSFLTEENEGWVMDLVCKGILHLAVSPQRQQHARKGFEDWNVAIDTSGMVFRQDAMHSDETPDRRSVVQELETKTTPTCLSSYIGQ